MTAFFFFLFQPPIVLLSKHEICESQICALCNCTAPLPQPLPLLVSIHQLQPRYGQLNMAATIDALAKCELRSVIYFLQAKSRSASEIQQRITITKEAYCKTLCRL